MAVVFPLKNFVQVKHGAIINLNNVTNTWHYPRSKSCKRVYYLESDLSNIKEDFSLLTLYPQILLNEFIRSSKAGKVFHIFQPNKAILLSPQPSTHETEI